jgi:hypothetical protein
MNFDLRFSRWQGGSKYDFAIFLAFSRVTGQARMPPGGIKTRVSDSH